MRGRLKTEDGEGGSRKGKRGGGEEGRRESKQQHAEREHRAPEQPESMRTGEWGK